MSNKTSADELPFRENVAAFILNSENLILVCQRADRFKDWQLPQGGIDSGETPEHAIKRELSEEVGLQNFIKLARTPRAISYLWPKELHSRGFQGQNQFLYCVQAPYGWEPALNRHKEIEFCAFRWTSKEEFKKLVSGTIREASYIEGLNYFTSLNSIIFA